ncbi:MAG: DUF2945 domain-containing protein [Verrucomicrobiaceae bacterium]
MNERFQVGDHVTWNSKAGHVTGHIVKVHLQDTDFHGYTHHASPEKPQYEIKSDKTDHIAMHKGSALTKIGGLMARGRMRFRQRVRTTLPAPADR